MFRAPTKLELRLEVGKAVPGDNLFHWVSGVGDNAPMCGYLLGGVAMTMFSSLPFRIVSEKKLIYENRTTTVLLRRFSLGGIVFGASINWRDPCPSVGVGAAATSMALAACMAMTTVKSEAPHQD